MYWFSLAVALLSALAIILIGVRYLISPASMVPSFGLPLPEAGPNTPWWLRLKGVRDVVSGLVILALIRGDHQALGMVLLIEALIPIGDMSVVLAGRGRTTVALGIHGVTALLMIAAAVPLLIGKA